MVPSIRHQIYAELISKAKKGDIRAVHELFDRAWGRPRQEVEIKNTEADISPAQPEIQELSAVMDEVFRLKDKGMSAQEMVARFREWHRSTPTLAATSHEVVKYL